MEVGDGFQRSILVVVLGDHLYYLCSISPNSILRGSVTKLQNALARLEIKAAVIELPLGRTTNDVPCPWCKEAKSFSITKTHRGDILFLCHRASCGESGYIRDPDSRASPPPTEGRKFSPRVFDLPTRKLEGTGMSLVVDRYGLTALEVQWAGWQVTYDGAALVFPVYSPYREVRGHVTKALDRTTVPKSLTYKEVDDVWLGWYIRNGVKAQNSKGVDSKVIIVEDHISALKASRIAPSVAIHGTYLNHDIIKEILEVSRNIVLCLDADATAKAYKYADEFALFGNFSALPLSKDLKDMNEKEFGEWSDRLT